jgi:aconitase A
MAGELYFLVCTDGLENLLTLHIVGYIWTEDAEYDQLIEINLCELEPHINRPFTPDLTSWRVSSGQSTACVKRIVSGQLML